LIGIGPYLFALVYGWIYSKISPRRVNYMYTFKTFNDLFSINYVTAFIAVITVVRSVYYVCIYLKHLWDMANDQGTDYKPDEFIAMYLLEKSVSPNCRKSLVDTPVDTFSFLDLIKSQFKTDNNIYDVVTWTSIEYVLLRRLIEYMTRITTMSTGRLATYTCLVSLVGTILFTALVYGFKSLLHDTWKFPYIFTCEQTVGEYLSIKAPLLVVPFVFAAIFAYVGSSNNKSKQKSKKVTTSKSKAIYLELFSALVVAFVIMFYILNCFGNTFATWWIIVVIGMFAIIGVAVRIWRGRRT